MYWQEPMQAYAVHRMWHWAVQLQLTTVMLPGFNTAASGTQQNSLDALRKASDTPYFKDKDALWVKVVSGDNGPIGLGGTTTLQVSR
jgi:hypothetical protein